MSTVLKSKWVKVRKDHSCWGCARKFKVGTNMHYFAGVTDGDFCSCYTCKLCNITIANNPYTFDDGFAYGEIEEFWQEYPEELQRAKKEMLTNR